MANVRRSDAKKSTGHIIPDGERISTKEEKVLIKTFDFPP